MKKVAYIAGLAGMAPAIAGFIVPGAANAATTKAGTQAKTVSIHPVTTTAGDYTCHGTKNTAGRYCSTSVDAFTVFYPRTGGSSPIDPGTEVRVTCYYLGAPYNDPYWDHVTRVSGRAKTGHVADSFVNFNGHEPTWSALGLVSCG